MPLLICILVFMCVCVYARMCVCEREGTSEIDTSTYLCIDL